jgi:hypothetical protein
LSLSLLLLLCVVVVMVWCGSMFGRCREWWWWWWLCVVMVMVWCGGVFGHCGSDAGMPAWSSYSELLSLSKELLAISVQIPN